MVKDTLLQVCPSFLFKAKEVHMVVGMITIATCYGDADIPVELLGKGPRPGTAWVKALNGLQPFTKISHGGPYQDNTILIPLPLVRAIHLEKDPNEEQEKEIAAEPIDKVLSLPLDWFLESAYESRVGDE
jgi:hypothetical protein